MERTYDEDCLKKCVALARMDEQLQDIKKKEIPRLEHIDNEQWNEINAMKRAVIVILTGICITTLSALGTFIAILVQGAAK